MGSRVFGEDFDAKKTNATFLGIFFTPDTRRVSLLDAAWIILPYDLVALGL